MVSRGSLPSSQKSAAGSYHSQVNEVHNLKNYLKFSLILYTHFRLGLQSGFRLKFCVHFS
jgi:hypothetical protein